MSGPAHRLILFALVLLNSFGLKMTASEMERVGYLAWERGYGGDRNEEFRSAALHPEGGFVFAGSSKSAISGDRTSTSYDVQYSDYRRGDFWWVHVDEAGEVQNDLSFGGEERETLSFMLPLSNGDFLLAGSSSSDPSGNKAAPSYSSRTYSDTWIIRIDKHGNKVWERSFGGSGFDSVSSGLELDDGRLILAGTTTSPAGTGTRTEPLVAIQNAWLFCLSPTGDLQWEKVYGGGGQDFFTDITQDDSQSERLLVAGYSSSGRFIQGPDRYSGWDYWILAVDFQGEIEWQRFYGGAHDDYATTVVSKSGTIILAGYSDSGISNSKTTTYYGAAGGVNGFTTGSRHHGWVVYLDSEGNKFRERIYGGSQQDEIEDLLFHNNGLLIGAQSNSAPFSDPSKGNKTSPNFISENVTGMDDYWFVATDEDGSIRWQLSAGGASWEHLEQLVPTAAGVLALGTSQSLPGAGNRQSERKGATDGWVALVAERIAPAGTVQVWVNDRFRDDAACTVVGAAEVELISSGTSLSLHYTVDGSEPTTGSPIYSTPLNFTSDTTIQAQAFDALGSPIGTSVTVPITVLERFPLVAESASGGSVSISPDSPDSLYTEGETVTLEAIPNTAWQFDRWTGDASGTDPILSIEMDSAKAVTANFYSLAITLSFNGSGTITKTPDKSLYEFGDIVTLVATPSPGFTFSHWQDGVTSPSRNVTIGKDNHYSATFIDLSSGDYETLYYAEDDWSFGSGNTYEDLYSIGALADGFLIASDTSDWPGSGDKTLLGQGLWMLRLNSERELVGQFMSGMQNSTGGRFSPTQDGGLLFPGGGIAQFSKFDSEGNEVWIRSYNADRPAPTKAVIETADGGYAILTRTGAGIGGDKTVPRPTTEGWNNNYDVWLLKTDGAGNILWQQSYGGDWEDDPHFILETTSGDFLILVTTSSQAGTGNNTSGPGVWVLKVNGQNGSILWQNSYGKRVDFPQGMVLNPDGGFTFAGKSSYSHGDESGSEWGFNSFVRILRADATGQVLWSRAYGGSGSDSAGALLGLENGGFLVAAKSNSPPSDTFPYNKTARIFGSNDFWLFRLDSDGNITWQDSFGGSGSDDPVCLLRDKDGRIIVGGDSNSPVSGTKTVQGHGSGYDFWFQEVYALSQKRGQPIIFRNGNAWSGSEMTGNREVQLELALGNNDYPIYYTLDGSDPLTNGVLATGTIQILEDSVLRAAAVPDNGDPSVEREPVTIDIRELYTLDINVPGGGSVSVDPIKDFYVENEVVTLTATPKPGWQFISWAGHITSETPEIQFSALEDVLLRADFGTNVGMETGSGSGIIEINPRKELYRFGEQVTLSASGLAGDVFNHWSGDISGSSNPLRINIGADTAEGQAPRFAAHFSSDLPQFPFVVSISGAGTVNQEPMTSLPGLNERITLTPIPAEGSVFSHWLVNSDKARENTLNLLIDQPIGVDAVFIDENEQWRWVYPNPIGGENFLDIAYGNGRFIGVGPDGLIRSSLDGYDWFLSDGVAPSIEITSISWNGTQFFGLGQIPDTSDFFAIISDDGENWESLPISGLGNIQGIAYGNGQYVASTLFGYGDYRLMTSTGLESWSEVQSSSDPFGALEFVGSKFIAATSDFYTSNDGVSWETNPSGQASAITSIRQIEDRFYATANDGVLSSQDGLSWELQVPNLPGRFTDIVKSGETYLLSHNSPTLMKPLYAGPSLSTLQEAEAFDMIQFSGIEASGNAFVVVGSHGRIRLSHDGLNFIEPIQPQIPYLKFPSLQTACFGPDGRIVAGGHNDNDSNNDQSYIVTTHDGESYQAAFVSGGGIKGLAYGAGKYLALVEYDHTISSNDGINWSGLSNPDIDGDVLRFAKDRFFILGAKLSHSTNGTNWSTGNFYNFATLVDALEFQGKVYLASKEALYRNDQHSNFHVSSSWSKLSTFEHSHIEKLATDGERILALSSQGFVGSTSDGINWNWVELSEQGIEASYLRDIAYDGRRFLLTVGSGLYSSIDGSVWLPHPVAGPTRSIAASEGRVVRMGGSLLIRDGEINASRLVTGGVRYTRGVTIPGENMAIDLTVVNAGNGDWTSNNPYYVDLYLSREASNGSASEVLVATLDGSNSMQAREQMALFAAFAIPAEISEGDYYLHVRFRHPEYTEDSPVAPNWVSGSPDIRVRINRFEDWIETQKTDASGEPVTAKQANDLTNGVANLLIYAEGLSTANMQSVSSGSVKVIEREGNKYFSLSYTRRRDAVDLEWVPQYSNNLIDWHDAAMTEEERIVQENLVTIKLRDSEILGSESSRFIRLKVRKK